MYLMLALVLIAMSWTDSSRASFFLGLMVLARGLVNVAPFLYFIQAPVTEDLSYLLRFAANVTFAFSIFFFYLLRGRRLPLFYWVCFCWWCLSHTFRVTEIVIPPEVVFRTEAWLQTPLGELLSSAGPALLLITSWLAAFLPFRSLRRSDVPFLTLTMILFAAYASLSITRMSGPGTSVAVRNFQSTALFPVVLCFVFLLILRMRRTATREAVLQRDMDAAREMQRRLVPERIDPVAGFHIDTAYLPAKEVGGDFYQFLPGDDGSLLVVMGDVSGKGLDAAMIVSTIIGALKNEQSREPASVLESLNRVVGGGCGFVTCSCALFRRDGTVEMASAGHIPPYRNGRELDLVPGPPLGILPDAQYESATVSLGAGAVSFFSDGVVEAKKATGELLGFERLASLSVKSAREIANEAEKWGQEDDITVVQVAYA
jgi:hypothetical protein